MPNYASLHQSRQKIGVQRQPDFSKDLAALNEILGEQGLAHPYDFSRKTLERLLKNSHYSEGCRGPAVDLSTISGSYFFRIASIGQIVASAEWIGPTYSDPRCPRSSEPPSVLFDYILEDSEHEGGWLPLSRFLSGSLVGLRGFTWWSTDQVPEEQWVTGAYKLGLVYEWLSPFTVILRCPISAIKRAHIPTSVDGFSSPIFDPMELTSFASHGRSIDVSDPASLADGFSEYVLGPIDVGRIDILPRELPEPIGDEVFLDDILIETLCLYGGSDK